VRERRLVFGEVADMYDRHRPSYPPALLDDLIALAALDVSEPALEVGAGTGKATMMLAARGIPIVAVEPNAANLLTDTTGLIRIRQKREGWGPPHGRQNSDRDAFEERSAAGVARTRLDGSNPPGYRRSVL
jgi:hypothetical protein